MWTMSSITALTDTMSTKSTVGQWRLSRNVEITGSNLLTALIKVSHWAEFYKRNPADSLVTDIMSQTDGKTDGWVLQIVM